MYDEQLTIPLFLARLRPVLDGLGLSYEVACIDDGSRDATAALVREAMSDWPELRLIRLMRNSGQQAALSCGFASARGDYVVTIDADLQDPPEVISRMVAVARSAKVDVVYGVRSDRSTDGWFKRTTSDLYYRLMRRLAGNQLPHDSGDFRLVSREVVEAIDRLPEHGRVHRLVIPWLGFPSEQVEYVRDPRAAGVTKYSLSKMLLLAFDSITAFSSAPLRLATAAGFLGGLVAILATIWSLYGWFTGLAVPGWTSILAVAGLIGAIQLICLGLLGEYVARVYVATQGRPSYLVGYDSLMREPSASRAERLGRRDEQ
jgi:dolichol-phosphate mannosyltransferase